MSFTSGTPSSSRRPVVDDLDGDYEISRLPQHPSIPALSDATPPSPLLRRRNGRVARPGSAGSREGHRPDRARRGGDRHCLALLRLPDPQLSVAGGRNRGFFEVAAGVPGCSFGSGGEDDAAVAGMGHGWVSVAPDGGAGLQCITCLRCRVTRLRPVAGAAPAFPGRMDSRPPLPRGPACAGMTKAGREVRVPRRAVSCIVVLRAFGPVPSARRGAGGTRLRPSGPPFPNS